MRQRKQKSTRRAWNAGYRVVVCGNCNPLGVPAWSGEKPRPHDRTQCPQCRQEARFDNVPTVKPKPLWKTTKELIRSEARRLAGSWDLQHSLNSEGECPCGYMDSEREETPCPIEVAKMLEAYGDRLLMALKGKVQPAQIPNEKVVTVGQGDFKMLLAHCRCPWVIKPPAVSRIAAEMCEFLGITEAECERTLKGSPGIIDEEAIRVAEEAKKTVNGWFEEAFRRKGSCAINLYYSPNAEAFERLTDVLYIGGVDTGMVCHRMADGMQQLFRVQAGSGDCEHNLYWVGKYETGSVSLGPKQKPAPPSRGGSMMDYPPSSVIATRHAGQCAKPSSQRRPVSDTFVTEEL